MRKNVASQVTGVQMLTDSTQAVFTGTVAVVVTIDGGTQTASAGTGPTHEGNGYYTYLPTQAETNGTIIAFTYTGTNATPATVTENTRLDVDDALVAQKLDHLVAVADSDDPVNDSIMAKLRASDGDWSGANESLHSLEFIGDTVLAIASVDFAALIWNALKSGYGTAGTYGEHVEALIGAGPTKAEMDTAHGLLATPAEAGLLQSTTITGLSSQTVFNLTAGSADNDAYNGCLVVVTDAATAVQKAVGFVFDYVAAAKTITLRNDPGIFTMANGDTIEIFASRVAAQVWDEVLTGATHNIASSAGRRLRNVQDFGIYDMASVWVDEVAGTSTGTTDGEDATVANRSDDFDNAQTVAASVGLDRIHIQNGNTITLVATLSGYNVWGGHYNLALGSQSVANSSFHYATVTGVGTGSGTNFIDSLFGAATLAPGTFVNCGIGLSAGTFTLGSAGAYRMIRCYSDVAGAAAPVIDMNSVGVGTTLELRDWRGGITLNNLTTNHVVTLDGIFGTITLNGADAAVEVRGVYKAVTNNLTGSPTVTLTGVKGTDLADVLVDTAAIKAVTDVIPDSGAMTSISTAAALATVDTNVDAVLVDTGTTLPASIATVDANVDAILVDTGTTIPATLGTPASTISADVAAVKVDTAATLVDTADMQPKLGAPAADLAADVAAVKVDTAATLVDTGTTIPASLTTIDTNVDAILVDTGTTLPATLATIDGIVDAILVDTGTTIPALIAALNDLSAANVNAEVSDVLKTDVVTLPGQVAPPLTPTMEEILGHLFKAFRNKITQTETAFKIYDDAGTTVDQTAVISDDDTTFTRGEIGAGP